MKKYYAEESFVKPLDEKRNIEELAEELVNMEHIDLSFFRISRERFGYVTNVLRSMNHLDDNHADYIAKALKKNKVIKSVDLSGNSIGKDGILKILEALNDKNSLNYINLSNNELVGMKVGERLQNILENNKLAELAIRSVKLDYDCVYKIIDGLKCCPTLTSLDVMGNNLALEITNHLLDTLKSHNPSLTKIDLELNKVSEKGVNTIVELLKTTPLNSINFTETGIENSGVTKIMEALKDNHYLSFLSLCDNVVNNSELKWNNEIPILLSKSKLKHLDLRDNNFTANDILKFLQALECNSFLGRLDLRQSKQISENDSNTPKILEELLKNHPYLQLKISGAGNIGVFKNDDQRRLEKHNEFVAKNIALIECTNHNVLPSIDGFHDFILYNKKYSKYNEKSINKPAYLELLHSKMDSYLNKVYFAIIGVCKSGILFGSLPEEVNYLIASFVRVSNDPQQEDNDVSNLLNITQIHLSGNDYNGDCILM